MSDTEISSKVAEALAIQLQLVGVGWNEILDAQLSIEGTTAERAAERATTEQVAELDALLDRCESLREDPQLFTELSIRFHHRIAEIAGNRALQVALHSLGPLQAEEYTPRTSPEVADSVLGAHRAIADKIRTGDGLGARALMNDHLSTVNHRARASDVATTRAASPAAAPPEAFKAAASKFATGVTVVTTRLDREVYGMTVSAFASLSLEPLLVLVSLNKRSPLSDMVERSGRFAISILHQDQDQVATYFATSDRPRCEEAFPGIGTYVAETGAPIISDSIAHFDCELHMVLPGGDHHILMGAVVDARADDGEPLLYYDGGFRRLATDS